MKFSEEANHKLYWAIIVRMVVATIMIMTSGCSTSILVKDCEPPLPSNKSAYKTLKPWE